MLHNRNEKQYLLNSESESTINAMTVDTVVKNCRLVNPWGTFNAGVAIEDGKIVAIANDSSLPNSDRTIDAKGNYLLPGIIDPHTHLNQGPELPDIVAAETRAFTTETQSAAVGGVTTVMTLLYRYESYLDIFEETKKRCEERAYVDVVFNGTILQDKHIEEIPECARKLGITAFKWLMPYRKAEAASLGLKDAGGVDDGSLYLGLQKIAQLGYPALAMIHTENVEIFERFSNMLKAQGRTDIDAWWEARPKFAEEEYIGRSIYFSKLTNAKIYIVHMSIAGGVKLIADAKAQGLKVTGETCTHYLSLTRDDVRRFGKLAKLNPPIRDREDVDALWKGVRDGTLECVGTDHCALTKELKDRAGDIWKTVPGFPGVATLLPVMLHYGVNKGRISLEKVAESCSYNTARVFGLYPQKGAIQIGADADLTIVDLNKRVKITPELLRSVSDYSLYEGMEFEGWPTMTMVRGNVVMEDMEIVGKPGIGRYLPRKLAQEEPSHPAFHK